MNTVADQLIVEIKAETASLRRGLDQVNTKLGSANKTARASMLTFGNLAKVFAAVGISKLVTGVVKTSRSFEDLRATIQANTGSMKETDAAFQNILDFTKTTTFQIEDVTKAFIEFRRLGITATTEQLKGIGNVAAAQNVGIDQMAAAIFKASTTSIESLQMLGFAGKTEGKNITLSFGSGADKIEETMVKNTENVLNFVKKVGELDFSTAIEDRAKTLTGAVSNLGDKVSIFQNQVGEAGLNKSLVNLATTFQVLLTEGGEKGLAGMLGGILSGAVDTLNNALVFANENAALVKKGLISLAAVVTVITTQAVFTGFASAIAIMTAAMSKALIVVKSLRNALLGLMLLASLNPAGATVVLGGAILGGGAILVFQEEIESAIKQATAAINKAFGDDETGVAKKPPSVDPTVVPNEKPVKKRLQTLTDLKAEIEAVTLRYSDMAQVLKILNGEVANGNVTQDEANAIYREFLETSGPVGKAMAQIGDEVKSLSSSFSDQFTSALLAGENALESFKSLAINVVQAVISSFMDLLVIQPIVDAILGSFNITGTKGGTGSSGGSGGGGGRFAGGGTVQGGSPVLVGERGAEIFVPNTGGTIMNNMNSKNAMGGGGTTVINQSINFATGVVPTVRAEVMKMMPQIADVTKGAVAEAAVRGGNYRRMLQGG
jgi:uncharacterized membrane protein YgcG